MLVKVGSELDSQLRILWAPSALGEGTGYISSATNCVTFTAPGDASSGTAVHIETGERQKVFASGSTTKYLVIERTGTDDLDCDDVPVVVDTQKDAHELLSEVDTAISRVLTAISAGSGDERIQRESLKNLRDYKAELVRQINRLDGKAPSLMSPNFANTTGRVSEESYE